MINYVIKTIDKIARYFTKSRIEPHIKYKCPLGFKERSNCYWQVYDPISGFSGYFTSEQEVKAWLDRRYCDEFFDKHRNIL